MLRAINNARVVTQEAVLEGATVVIEEGRIAGLLSRPERSGQTIDAAGRYVLPGLVDLHSDVIEQQLVPRPGVEFMAKIAFLETDRIFAGCGITSGFHAISFMRDTKRSPDRARLLCEVVDRFREEGLVHNKLHVRCELPEDGTVEAVKEILSSCDVRIVSMMDHTPGQGQFSDLEWFRRYWTEDLSVDDSEVAAAIERASLVENGIVADRTDRLSRASRSAGVIFASHDDDSPGKVDLLSKKGVEISEFPINAETALRAKELELSVFLGAPNAVRGKSSGGNLSVSEAVRLGLVDGLCSDYHPPSMLVAAFRLAERDEIGLPEAIQLVSSGPAYAIGMNERGNIREGAAADLVIVERRLGLPTASQTIVDGFPVCATGRVEDRPTARDS